MPDNQEFSYDRDIGGYASKYFDSIDANTRLSHERKAQLQGTLLGGVEDIQNQRLKMQKEKDEGVLRSLDVRKTQSDLEDARARRIQMQKDTEAIGGAKERVNSILGDASMSPEQKRQLLAQEELNHPLAGDQNLSRVFNLGREALPKEKEQMFTPSQQVEFLAKVANSARPEDAIAALRDPAAMAQLRAAAEAQEKEDKEANDLRGRKDAEAHEIRKGMMLKDLKFAKDETDAPTSWLDDESTRDAEMIVLALGTPEEQKAFSDLKDAPSDEPRADLVRSIQRRELEARLNGKGGAKAPEEDRRGRTRSLIFGK
jgi:hypothetical protein